MDFSALLDQALSRTYGLLWERRSFRRWRNFAGLTLLSNLSSAGFQSPPPAGSRESGLRGLLLGSAVGAAGLGFDSLSLTLLGLGLLLGLFVLWLSSVARLALIENILQDREDVVEPMRRFLGPGASVFGWTLAVFGTGLAVMTAAAAALVVVLGPDIDPEALDPSALLGVLLPVFLVLLAGLAVLSVLACFNLELALPIMIRRGQGELGAWSTLVQVMARAPASWLLYGLVRFLLALATGAMGLLVLLLGGLAEALLVGLVVGLPGALLFFAMPGTAGATAAAGALLLGACLLLLLMLPLAVAVAVPITVFGHCFGLYALQAQAPELELLSG